MGSPLVRLDYTLVTVKGQNQGHWDIEGLYLLKELSLGNVLLLNTKLGPCLGGRMVKAPGRVKDIPVTRVRNHSRANVRVWYENVFVEKIGHVDVSN